jgi:hypothetical protein
VVTGEGNPDWLLIDIGWWETTAFRIVRGAMASTADQYRDGRHREAASRPGERPVERPG